jgi:hypothetical protein
VLAPKPMAPKPTAPGIPGKPAVPKAPVGLGKPVAGGGAPRPSGGAGMSLSALGGAAGKPGGGIQQMDLAAAVRSLRPLESLFFRVFRRSILTLLSLWSLYNRFCSSRRRRASRSSTRLLRQFTFIPDLDEMGPFPIRRFCSWLCSISILFTYLDEMRPCLSVRLPTSNLQEWTSEEMSTKTHV